MTEYTIPTSTAYSIVNSDTYSPVYMGETLNGAVDADISDAILYTGGGNPSIQDLYDEGYLPNIISISVNEPSNATIRSGSTFSGSLTNLTLKDGNGDYNKHFIVAVPSQSEIVYRDGLSVWSKIAILGNDAITNYELHNQSNVFEGYSSVPDKLNVISSSSNGIRAEIEPSAIIVFYWQSQFNIVEGLTYKLNLDYEIHSGEIHEGTGDTASNIQIGCPNGTNGQPIPPLHPDLHWWLYHEDGGYTADGVQTLEKSFTGVGTSSGEPDLDLNDDLGSQDYAGFKIQVRSGSVDPLDIEFSNVFLKCIETSDHLLQGPITDWTQHTYSSYSFTELDTSSVSWTEV